MTPLHFFNILMQNFYKLQQEKDRDGGGIHNAFEGVLSLVQLEYPMMLSIGNFLSRTTWEIVSFMGFTRSFTIPYTISMISWG